MAEFKNLDLIVLADRSSSVCRAYLAYLKAYHYKPAMILLVDFIGHSKKASILRALAGRKLTLGLMRLYRNITGSHADQNIHCTNLVNYMDSRFEHTVPFFGKFNYPDYAQETRSIIVTGLDDPQLSGFIKNSSIQTVLFTGGGFVKQGLLGLPGKKFIHIHPGIVPDIRGADGILWSALLRKKLGYSGFYMGQGIDTGDVLCRQEYDLPCFIKSKVLKDNSYDDMYKALLFGYDAHLRAITLIKLLTISDEKGRSLADLPSEPQNSNDGRVYFFMHNLVRNAALELMLQ